VEGGEERKELDKLIEFTAFSMGKFVFINKICDNMK
jgi:hypothetical protein